MATPSEAATVTPSPPARAILRLAQNSAFGSLAAGAWALGSVLGSVLVAHILGVENTGVVAFALWVVTVAVTVADLGVQQTLARYLPELIASGKAADAERLATASRLPLTASAVLALAVFAAYALFQQAPLADGGAALWVLVGLACALQTLAGSTYGRLRGEQRFNRMAVVTIASLGCQLAGIAVGSSLFGVSGALAGYCAGSLLPAALALRGRSRRPALSPELRGRIVRYSLYAWAAALSATVVWSRAELFFLQRSAGSAAVGLFSVGVTLANIAAQGPMLLTPALLPHFAQSFGRNALAEMRTTYATATRLLAFLVFPACCGLAAIMPAVLPIMYGSAFADAVPAATVLVLAAGIGATSSVGTSLVMAMDRGDFIFLSGALAAALTVVAGFTIIPMFGLMGAAWSRAAIQVALVGSGAWFILRRLNCPLPLFDLGKLLLAAILCGATARLCLFAMPGAVSLPAAMITGVVTYVAAVKLLRALPAGDIEQLYAVAGTLPTRLQRPAEIALRLIGDGPLVTCRTAGAAFTATRDAD